MKVSNVALETSRNKVTFFKYIYIFLNVYFCNFVFDIIIIIYFFIILFQFYFQLYYN